MLVNINSKYIIDKIFEYMKNKRKLNIIKYNKRTLDKLKITKEHFEIYIALKEFKMKYNLNIDDIDIEELDLSRKHIGNEGLKYLIKIDFEKLNKLNLSGNKISDISILKDVNFKELKELNLSYNEISYISILKDVNFKELNQLNLRHNEISDINI